MDARLTEKHRRSSMGEISVPGRHDFQLLSSRMPDRYLASTTKLRAGIIRTWIADSISGWSMHQKSP